MQSGMSGNSSSHPDHDDPNSTGISSLNIPSMSLGHPVTVASTSASYTQTHVDAEDNRWQYLYVLPVLLLEFLAIALTRAVLPSILLQQYGDRVYLVLGGADAIRGMLAFVACPFFGKASDLIGRKICLFVTVLGTCAPVCALALFPWQQQVQLMDDQLLEVVGIENSTTTDTSIRSFWSLLTEDGTTTTSTSTTTMVHFVQPSAITTFVILLSLSGLFSSTFTLVFAYISDTVRQQDERVSAYGLALATFGLSFTIGPMAGGYLARSNTHYVFLCSLFFTILDLLYIYFILPESKQAHHHNIATSTSNDNNTLQSSHKQLAALIPHEWWSPWKTLKVITMDPFLRTVGKVAFLYYTGLWAIISTLSVYAVKRFHLSPERLGELMSALGLCTMVAEAVLVRIIVPMLGEKQATRIGLLAFLLQCVVLGLAYEGWHLFLCTVFSMFANLVYPSLSSLVSGSVEPHAVGEALGAINGIKALTEGIGPLVFGSLMTLSEHSLLPGWPYLLAAVLAYFAYLAAEHLPDPNDDDYIPELQRRKERKRQLAASMNNNHHHANGGSGSGSGTGIMLQHLINTTPPPPPRRAKPFDDNNSNSLYYGRDRQALEEQEEEGLLSDVEESEDGDGDINSRQYNNGADGEEDVTRLPITFASLVNLPPP